MFLLLLIATIRVEVAAGLEPAMLGNLLHLPCNTGLVRFTMMPSFHNIVTKSTKSCQRLPIPPYYQICVSFHAVRLFAVPTKCKESNLVAYFTQPQSPSRLERH